MEVFGMDYIKMNKKIYTMAFIFVLFVSMFSIGSALKNFEEEIEENMKHFKIEKIDKKVKEISTEEICKLYYKDDKEEKCKEKKIIIEEGIIKKGEYKDKEVYIISP
jgi:hypothetical protein